MGCKRVLKYYLLLTIIGISSLLAPTIVKAIPANPAFKDDNFYNCVLDAAGLEEGTNITEEQLKIITSLVCNDKQITDTSGLELMTSLTKLYLYNNQLTEIDVTKNTLLTYLNLYGNKLTNIDVSKNTALKTLYLENNRLTGIDLSKNTALTKLSLNSNQLAEIDVSKNVLLEHLYLYDNLLTNIDVTKNVNLTELSVAGNQLTELDATNNINLIKLAVGGYYYSFNGSGGTYSGNKISSIDLSKNTALKTLYLENNQLTNIDLSNNTILTFLSLENNQLTNIDLSNNTILTFLSLENNRLTGIDLSKNTALTKLSLNSNQLAEIDVSKNVLLEHLYLYDNLLTKLDVTKNVNLTELSVTGNKLTELDTTNNINLIKLAVGGYYFSSGSGAYTYKGNKISSLDLSKNTSLTSLHLSYNNFKYNKGIYLGDTLLVEPKLIKLPTDLQKFKVNTIDSNYISLNGNQITALEVGNTTIGSLAYIGSSTSNGATETMNLYIIEATSDKYNINGKSNYIYTGLEKDTNTILSNVKLNYGTSSIADNKLILKYEDEVVKEFNVMNVSIDKYKANEDKEYIYVGSEKDTNTILSNVKLSYGTSSIDNGKLTIKYEDEVVKEFNVMNVSIDKYKANEEKGIIYIGLETNTDKILSDVKLSYGTSSIDNGKLTIKYEDEVVKEFNLLNISSEVYDLSKTTIKVKDNEVSKAKGNIICTSCEVKIYDNELEKTEGLVGTGDKVKVSVGNEVVDEFDALVVGDTTGDGKITVADVAKTYQYLKKKIEIDDLSKEAGNVVGTGTEIKINDVAKLYQYVKNKINSLD